MGKTRRGCNQHTGFSPRTTYHLHPTLREDHLAETKVTVRNNGPLRIEGEFTICDAEGNPFDLAGRTGISLCRCGHSENKPFCDNSHKKVEFQSEVKARQLPPPPLKPPPA